MLVFNKLSKKTDEELVKLIQKGNKEAFEEIYSRYWSKLYAFAYKRLKSREAVEEIVQDLFTNLWVRKDSLLIHKTFASYIFTSIRYKILNHIHSNLIRKAHHNYIKESVSDYDNTTVDTLAFNELNGAYNKQIDALPDRCKMVFDLSRKQSYSIKEIAEELNISTNTVENQMNKALKFIRINLQEFISVVILVLVYV